MTGRGGKGFMIGLAAACLINFALLWYFHDRFWWPPDDGVFAHVAERVLDGEVLHRDVEEARPGYNIFVNAAALQWFGRRFVSLRYPLVLAGLLQSVLIFLVTARYGLLLALAASTASTAFGIIQFFNPVQHWYCLLGVVVVAAALTRLPRNGRIILPFVGFSIVTVYLFRQLTGILVAMGVLAYLLSDGQDDAGAGRPGLARAVIVLMAAGLGCYLVIATDWLGSVLFGVWPLAVLAVIYRQTDMSNAKFAKTLASLAAGGAAGVLPLTAYHTVHRSLGPWFQDTVVRAVSVLKQPFLWEDNLGFYLAGGFNAFMHPENPADIINGLYWMVLPLLALANGLLVLRCLIKQGRAARPDMALPIMSVFYAVVTLHNQISIYLYFTVGLSIVSLLLLAGAGSRRRKNVAVLAATVLCAVAVYYHAAQSLVRGDEGVIRGRRVEVAVAGKGLKRLGIKTDRTTLDMYQKLEDVILSNTLPSEAIWAVPNNAELYFLTGRKNPFRFYSTFIGLQSGRDADRVIRAIEHHPPRLVTYSPSDKRNTPYSRKIMDHVRERYELIGNVYYFEIYRYAGRDRAL